VLAVLAGRAGVRQWPVTFTVATPSGGAHLYYTAPAGRPIGNKPLGPLIDVRGGGDSNGGYVLGPGSVLNGRPYRVTDDQPPVPLPAWIADLLDPPATAAPVSGGNHPRISGVTAYGRLRGVIDNLVNLRPGDRRNTRLFWAACRAAEMIAAAEVDAAAAEEALFRAAEENGHVAKHGERATRATIASGLRKGAA